MTKITILTPDPRRARQYRGTTPRGLDCIVTHNVMGYVVTTFAPGSSLGSLPVAYPTLSAVEAWAQAH